MNNMKKQFLALALFVISFIKCYSQIVFEDAYFIDESNKKIECLIKNLDWRNNPTEFEYKLSQEDIVKTATIQSVKEFGIYDDSKYIKAKTNIDRSSDQINKISSDRNPSFKKEMIFLKVLIEGQASLFLYVDGSLKRFFYSIGHSGINQLVYKKYLFEGNVVENYHFKQQLLLDLKCDKIGLDEIKSLRYTNSDLKKIFLAYNECTRAPYTKYESKQKDLFNLSIRPGLDYHGLEIQSSTFNSRNTDFGKKTGIRFGLETEFILPFNKNKWAIIIEPTYQYFKSEQSQEVKNLSGGILISKVNYESIELPIGFRHYFHLNNNSKIFTNLSYIFDFAYNSEIQFSAINDLMLSKIDIKTGRNLALGIGYKFMDRISLEIRYNTNREVLSNYIFWDSSYSNLSTIFGISLF